MIAVYFGNEYNFDYIVIVACSKIAICFTSTTVRLAL